VFVFLFVLAAAVGSDAFGDAGGEFAFGIVGVAGAGVGPVVDDQGSGW
jgi:hypothetical protein